MSGPPLVLFSTTEEAMFIRCVLVQDLVQSLDVLIELYEEGADKSQVQVFTCERDGSIVWNHQQMTYKTHLSGAVEVLTGSGYCPCEPIEYLDGARVLVKVELGDHEGSRPVERRLIIPENSLVPRFPIMIHTKDDITTILRDLVGEAIASPDGQEKLIKEAAKKVWGSLPLAAYKPKAKV